MYIGIFAYFSTTDVRLSRRFVHSKGLYMLRLANASNYNHKGVTSIKYRQGPVDIWQHKVAKSIKHDPNIMRSVRLCIAIYKSTLKD